MSQNIILSNRLKEVLLNGNWVANTNFKEQLQNVNWQQATQKVGNLNTIAALTYHINYYLVGLLSAFETGILEIKDKYSFDVPEITNEADWNTLLHNLLTNAEKFASHIAQMDNALFDQPFIDPKYGTYLRNIECVIEHSYYHLGQIVLIKKLMAI